MIALGAKNIDFSENRNLDMDDINELLDKINNLEVKLQHKECLAEELKRYEKVDLENEDLKKEIKIFEETIRYQIFLKFIEKSDKMTKTLLTLQMILGDSSIR